MTYHPSIGLMVAHANIAMRAFLYFPAADTLESSGPCTTGAEYYDLSALVQGVSYPVYEFSGERSGHTVLLSLCTCVYYFYVGILRPMVAGAQSDKDMASGRGVVYFFERWSGRTENDVAACVYLVEYQCCVSSVVSWGRGVLLV